MTNGNSGILHQRLSRKKRMLFSAIVILVSSFIAFSASELILRYRRHKIQKSDHLDHGLIIYDKHLGWRLAPKWKGRHKHYDFDVAYSTNRYGFRDGLNIGENKGGPSYAFVGDSFTFSFGVNDNEAFVQLLNSQEKQKNKYLNFGIPGYSTDQEYLLIRERIFYFRPDVILLVVYLANDLFDNELPYPLQANHAKPYFELTPDGLALRNTPVPLKTKPKRKAQTDLRKVVFGDNLRTGGVIAGYLSRFELFRLLRLNLYKAPELSIRFDDRFGHALRLFTAIIARIRDACIQRSVKLNLILMPGKSFVERPGLPSALFQEYLRKKIVENSDRMKVKVIDLAFLLRERFQKHPGRWFYPNEGHLTAEGHRVVTDILAPLLPKELGNQNKT